MLVGMHQGDAQPYQKIGDRGAAAPQVRTELAKLLAEVAQLQQRLLSLGYWLGTPDGEYGTLTVQAVMAFQKVHGLSRDGAIGPQTLAAIESLVATVRVPHEIILFDNGSDPETVDFLKTQIDGRFESRVSRVRDRALRTSRLSDEDGTAGEEPLPKVGVPALLVIQPRLVELKGPGAYGQISIQA